MTESDSDKNRIIIYLIQNGGEYIKMSVDRRFKFRYTILKQYKAAVNY